MSKHDNYLLYGNTTILYNIQIEFFIQIWIASIDCIYNKFSIFYIDYKLRMYIILSKQDMSF